MGKFLRENWLWILAPILIVLGLFAAVLLLQGDETGTEFIYPIF